MLPSAKPTLTIASLNAVSGISHLAQFGMLYPLLALWLEAHGMPTWQVGLVGTAVWIGMLLGNLFAPAWLQRVGPAPLTIVGCLGTAAMAMVAPHLPAASLLLWMLAAGVLGIGVGLRWISVESWLYSLIDGAQRGRLVAIHETLIYAGQAAGPALIAIVGVMSGNSFYWGAGFAVLALAPLLLARTPMPLNAETPALSAWAVLPSLVRNLSHSLGIQIGAMAGLIDGMLLGMLGPYLIKRSISADEAAVMMMVFGLGGLLSQLPMGFWSDRRGIRSATRAVAITGILGAALLLPADSLLIWPAVALLGVVAACGLTASIIAGTEQAAESGRDMALAVTEISIAFTLGSAVGPALAGFLMNGFGLASFPVAALLSCAGLYLIALRHRPC